MKSTKYNENQPTESGEWQNLGKIHFAKMQTKQEAQLLLGDRATQKHAKDS